MGICHALKSGLAAAVVAVLLPLAVHAQVVPDWTAAVPNTYGAMLALDKDNNAYVAGSVPWTTVLITKYGPSGAQLWQRIFDNPGTREQGSWVTTDAAGNAIVTGRIVSGANNNPSGLVVLKYSPSGELLWQDVIASAFGYAARATTDAAGNVYVLGRAFLTNASGNTTSDIVTIKYSSDGTRQWLRSLAFDDWSADSPTSMALTPDGNLIVTGAAGGWMLMAAYDPAGNLLWSKTVAASTGALDVAVGPAGEFYVVGGGYSPATGGVFLVIKHDAGFNELWRKTYAVGEYGMRVAVDPQGNAVVAGVAHGGYLDWMTIKLDPSGTLLWSRRYDQHFNDEIPYFMVLGPDGSAYVTGQGGPGPTSGETSYLRTVAVRYAPDGAQLWSATTFDGVRGLGVRLATDQSIFVLGQSPQTVFHYRQPTVANQPPTAVASATTPTSGAAPLSVGFSSAGSADPDGSIVATQWTFGDGTRSFDANPSHSFSAGSHAATLTVTDNLGGASTSTVAVTSVPPPPTPQWLSFASSTVKGGSNVSAALTVSSTAGVVVALASSNPDVARVPASVQIPAGSSSANFTVRTSRVKSSTPVTITATANGASVSATLTVVAR